MSNLKGTIESLANEFAMSIISALRAASIDELTGVTERSARAAAPPSPPSPAVLRPALLPS